MAAVSMTTPLLPDRTVHAPLLRPARGGDVAGVVGRSVFLLDWVGWDHDLRRQDPRVRHHGLRAVFLGISTVVFTTATNWKAGDRQRRRRRSATSRSKNRDADGGGRRGQEGARRRPRPTHKAAMKKLEDRIAALEADIKRLADRDHRVAHRAGGRPAERQDGARRGGRPQAGDRPAPRAEARPSRSRPTSTSSARPS